MAEFMSMSVEDLVARRLELATWLGTNRNRESRRTTRNAMRRIDESLQERRGYVYGQAEIDAVYVAARPPVMVAEDALCEHPGVFARPGVALAHCGRCGTDVPARLL